MKITWLGQAGLLFEKDGFRILIDPYLSDSVVRVNPKNYRRVPIDERFLKIQPDVFICTHNHLDHYDPDTAPVYLKREQPMTVLFPRSVFDAALPLKGVHNFVLFDRHTEWTEHGIRFRSVKAVHSDDAAVGVLIDDGEKNYYVTGDTLYSEEIFSDLHKPVDVLFLPINGVGNNMNMTDAARFAAKVGAKKTVPLHFGMFDELNPELFCCENRVIPKLYEEIPV